MKISLFLLLPLVFMPSCNKKSENAANAAPVQAADVKTAETAAVPAALPDTRPLAATIVAGSFECATLDYGIYWFGKGDTAQKASSTTRSSYYDPTKPTFLYVHGWQAGSHVTKKRPTYNYSKVDPFYGPKVDEADAWIDAGWNVGIFYWNQFSDETSVRTAEDKIWESTPMTWQNCSGKAESTSVPSGNALDLLFSSYTDALKDYKGPNIRLAGHSLGNQMVTRLAARVADEAKAGRIDAHLVPKRVTLLDPFWSAAIGSGPSRAAQVRALIAPLKAQGMIFEWYKTSTLSEVELADANLELRAMIGRTEMDPDYYSAKNSVSRHGAAAYLYFLSFANPAPHACKAPCTDLAPSAATTDERMLELMNKASVFQQVTGMDTPGTADNSFELKSN